MKLNREQEAAASAPIADHLTIVAGPGTGKTRTLVARAQFLIAAGVRADWIVALSFTVSAAAELEERMPQGVTCSTLHGWAALVLESVSHLRGRTIYDPTEANDLRGEAQRTAGRGVRADTVYRQWLREAHATDYDLLISDLLEWVRTTTGPLPTHVLVDEAQDLDEQQHAVLEALRVRGVWVTTVGDPRQSIFRWRDARPDLWKAYGTVVNLTKNYRSSAEIVAYANARQPLLGARDLPCDPIVATVPPGGQPVVTDARTRGNVEGLKRFVDTARHVSGAEATTAILCRSWWGARQVRSDLAAADIPCRWYGPSSTSWNDPAGRLLARWLRLALPTAQHDANLVSWVVRELRHATDTRAVLARRPTGWSVFADAVRRGDLPAMPPTASARDVGAVLVDHIRSHPVLHAPDLADAVAAYLPQLEHRQRSTVKRFAWWWALGRGSQITYDADPKVVHVMTVHGAKGLEFDAVLFVDDGRESPDVEELCIRYVAHTRARRLLWVA